MEHRTAMGELEGIYKLTEQCSVDFSQRVMLQNGISVELPKREFIALRVLTDAALHDRIATFDDFGNALWPETGWDSARRQALKDSIHNLRGFIGPIIRSRSSVGYVLTVTPAMGSPTSDVGSNVTNGVLSRYTAVLERFENSALRASALLKGYEQLSAELHTDSNIQSLLRAHQERVRQYQLAPDQEIDYTSQTLYDITTGADIRRFEQEVANLDYITGELGNSLPALRAAANRIKRKMQELDRISKSLETAESLPAGENCASNQGESMLPDDSYARIVDSIEHDIDSCEFILSNLTNALHMPMRLTRPGAVNLRPEPFRELHSSLEASNLHLTALQENICLLSRLCESGWPFLGG